MVKETFEQNELPEDLAEKALKNLRAVSLKDGAVKLWWDAPFTGYVETYQIYEGENRLLAEIPGTQNSWQAEKVKPGAETEFVVVAIDKAGRELARLSTKRTPIISYLKVGVPNVISKMAIDYEGNFWLARGCRVMPWAIPGLQKYDRKRGVWTLISMADGLISNYIADLLVDKKGNVWVVMDRGISCFDGERWINYADVDDDYPYSAKTHCITHIALDSRGNLWANYVEDGNILKRYDGSEWVEVTTVPKQIFNGPQGLSGGVSGLAVDSDNAIWVVSINGVAIFDGKDWRSYTLSDGTFPVSPKTTNLGIWGLAASKDKSVWLCVEEERVYSSWEDSPRRKITQVKGRQRLIRFDLDFRIISEIEGVLWIRDLFVDDDNQLWVMSAEWHPYWENPFYYPEGYGITKFVNGEWNTVAHGTGMATDKKGNLWLVTDEDIRRDDASDNTAFAQSGFDEFIQAMTVDDKHRLWLLGKTKIGIFDGNRWTDFRAPEPLTQGYSFHLRTLHKPHAAAKIGGDGSLWVGTDLGLWRFRDKNWESFGQKDGLPSNRVLALEIDSQSNIWVALEVGEPPMEAEPVTWENKLPDEERNANLSVSLAKYDGTSWHLCSLKDGLHRQEYNDIAVDPKGHLWVGTKSNGALCFNGEGWTRYTQADGLSGDYVRKIVCDRQGRLWFLSGRLVQPGEEGYSEVLKRLYLKFQIYDGKNWDAVPIPGWKEFDRFFNRDYSFRADTSEFSLAFDSENNLWMAVSHYDHSILRFDGSSWKRYDGLKAFRQGVLACPLLAVGRDDNIWVALDSGLYKIENI